MKTTLPILALLLTPLLLHAQTQPAKTTLAVLPFIYATDADKPLAEKMRFAVSKKLSRSGNFDRKDNVEVDQTLSALQIPMSTQLPSDDDLTRALQTLGTDQSILGQVCNRTLTLTLYTKTTPTKSAKVDIPPGTDSPKLAVESILTALTATQFEHIREVEADHSDPKLDTALARAKNLVLDPDFSAAATDPSHSATKWSTLLGADEIHPPLVTADDALNHLAPDNAAIFPLKPQASSVKPEYALLMRMSKNVAENNGLACVSTWIPVTNNTRYRFSCKYKSDGPTLHLFLKGFAQKPDQFGDKSDPEATRREYYRYQVVPRGKAENWTLIEADFTPSVQKPEYPPIQWLRIDLYIYLAPGDVQFKDITLKKFPDIK